MNGGAQGAILDGSMVLALPVAALEAIVTAVVFWSRSGG